MNLTTDSLVKQVQDKYKSQKISFDDSYVAEVEKYFEMLSNIPEVADSQEELRNRILTESVLKISDIAVGIGREKKKKAIGASLFNEALAIFERKYKAYHGPMREPDSYHGPMNPPHRPTGGSGGKGK